MNRYVVIPLLVVVLVQISKILFDYIKTGKFNYKKAFESGGMPSSHSAGVMTLSMMVGKYEGFDSVLFAIAICFSIIVIYDAQGVRLESGKHAIELNKSNNTKLKESIGHTKIEVLIGSLIGIIVGFLA